MDDLAGDEPGLGGCEVQDRRGHVGGLAEALDAVVTVGALGDLVEGLQFAERLSVDQSRGYALAVTPWRPSSLATDLVSPTTPALAAE